MKSCIVDSYISYAQTKMYSKLNNCSKQHSTLGRFSSIPVAIADVILQRMKNPLSAIEHIAIAAINLFGVAFSDKCSIKHTLQNVELALEESACIPVSFAMTPFKLVYQIFAGLYDPQTVNSCNFYPEMGDKNRECLSF